MLDPTLGYSELARLWGWGALGAFAGVCGEGKRLKLPRLCRQGEDGPEADLGFLAPVFAGGVVGLVCGARVELAYLPVDDFGPRSVTAVLAGIAVAALGPTFLNTILSPFLRRFAAREGE